MLRLGWLARKRPRSAFLERRHSCLEGLPHRDKQRSGRSSYLGANWSGTAMLRDFSRR
jgi:hypothetical protein